MEFGISTLCLADAAVTLDTLEKLRTRGFKRLELYASRPSFDFHDKALVRSIARWFAENELPAPSIHLPFEEELHPGITRPLSVVDTSPLERQIALDEIKRCLEIVERITTSYVVLHLGLRGQQFHPVVVDYAYSAVATIQSFSGARVLLENLENDIAVPERIQELVSVAALQNVGICYDIGHGNESDAFNVPVSAVHINDNDGISDLHQWPLEGRINWPMFVEGLVTRNYDGPLILEARDKRLGPASECVSRLRDWIDEARHSIEEFRLKYKLPHKKPGEN